MTKVTIKSGRYIAGTMAGPKRQRFTVKASKAIDILFFDAKQYESFSNASGASLEEIHNLPRLKILEETDTEEFVLDIPSGDCWLVLLNAYEGKPVKVAYESSELHPMIDCGQSGGHTLEMEMAAKDIFLIMDGVRLAKRGHPGTAQAKKWIPLLPEWEINEFRKGEELEIEVKRNGEVIIPIGAASSEIH